MQFTDRIHAGRLLARKLGAYADDAVIYALPRGGVRIGAEVALELEAPLDLIIAQKIGHPANPEYAIGAVTATGPAVWNDSEKAGLDDLWCQQAEEGARAEAQRRQLTYLASRSPIPISGKTAIIVDDGIATGLTMAAAVNELKTRSPRTIVVAAPVASREAVDLLIEMTANIVLIDDPDDFLGAIGLHYDNFPQLSDDEVMAALDEAETI